MNRRDDYSLEIRSECPNRRKYIFAFFSLFILLFLSYSNSFDCSWHHDDYKNIVANANIQIGDLSWQSIHKGFYGIAEMGRWQRPVAYFSFALNYYFGGLDVFGYHLVNFLIHSLTAFFLFLFIFHTLQLPLMKRRYERHAYSIALLSAVLWAINPVHVPSVTYIVQRMASMAGLFYIMTMFFYLQGRTAKTLAIRIAWLILCALAGVLAIGTKENAAMLPLTLFLYDLILLQGVTKHNLIKNMKYAVMAAVAVLWIGFLYTGDVSVFQEEYRPRVFTMAERLMTQPRVLIFYLSLLFYPVTSRLTLIHDIELSRSLLDPITTLLSLSLICFFIAVAIFLSRKRPLIAYCIIFFFLNHLIEGSFIALELVYEHRNYVPSMLLFLPISLLMIHGLAYYRQRRDMLWLLAAAVVFVIMIQGGSVFLQNNIYKNEISLWSDNVEKSSRLHYVRQNLATAYFIAGRLTEAFNEANRAMASPLSAGVAGKGKTYALLGEYYYLLGEDGQAFSHYEQSVKLDPSFHVSYKRMSEIMLRKGRLIEATDMIFKALSIRPDAAAYHTILSQIWLQRGYPDDAIREALISLRMHGSQFESYALLAEAFKIKKDIKTSVHFQQVADTFRSRHQGLQSDPLWR
jgi:tetratricopeptide (TPR) repeat protein